VRSAAVLPNPALFSEFSIALLSLHWGSDSYFKSPQVLLLHGPELLWTLQPQKQCCCSSRSLRTIPGAFAASLHNGEPSRSPSSLLVSPLPGLCRAPALPQPIRSLSSCLHLQTQTHRGGCRRCTSSPLTGEVAPFKQNYLGAWERL